METTVKKTLVISRIIGALIIFTIVAFLFLAFVIAGIPHGNRNAANESAAVSSLRTIDLSNAAYADDHPQQGYAKKLSDLASRPPDHGKDPDWTIDPVLASGQKGGYKFTYSSQSTKADGKLHAYQVMADPLVPGKTGTYHFLWTRLASFACRIRVQQTQPALFSNEVVTLRADP